MPPHCLHDAAADLGCAGRLPCPELLDDAFGPIELVVGIRGFDDAISLVVDGLPEGVTAKFDPIAKGKTAAVVTLSGTAQLSDGLHKLRISGSATSR